LWLKTNDRQSFLASNPNDLREKTMPDRSRILIVDDTLSNISILNEILGIDYNISVATNGTDALEIVAKQVKPDLILLDIMMPEMDGYEVCRRLQADKQTKNIPIIFVTAMNDIEDETKGITLGAVDYITKPISPPIVKARVRNHLLLKKRCDQMQESISLMAHEAEILRHKAELGIQAGGLAHDINNILSAAMIVEMIPDLLPKKYNNKQIIKDYIELAMDSIALGSEICHGYTSYLRNIDLAAEIQDILPLLEPVNMYARRFRGKIIKDFAPKMPAIFCKGYQVKRVLVNLITNACQSIENQADQMIVIKVWHHKDKIYIAVQDSGPGISDEILPHIFEERFTTREKGTGLGLFMVKEIMNSHHGTVTVETKPGQGTTVTLCFPCA